ncbi:MAG TPA: LUD domain-containing protein [Puia sp.]|jgi:L-lactate dehydrogenase complex protein LldG|nr:LUD domain-containing protein [Puia sp.]
MKVSSAKENILKKIRQALSQSTPIPFPQSEGHHSVFQPATQDPEIEFAEQFARLQGKFIFCVDHQELVAQLNTLIATRSWKKVYCREEKLKTTLKENSFDNFAGMDLAECDAAVTTCELLVARTGSIVMSAAGPSGRTVSVYAPIHICIAYTDQLVYDIRDGLQLLKEKYQHHLPSLITFATGPSRTADIEKTLVVGVHGPKEVYLFLVDR